MFFFNGQIPMKNIYKQKESINSDIHPQYFDTNKPFTLQFDSSKVCCFDSKWLPG